MSLRFKVDENLAVEVTEYLQQAGYDAKTVGQERLTGSPDKVIAATCERDCVSFETPG
jgi:predicted nuclease of predicted toxin-antitoxin system